MTPTRQILELYTTEAEIKVLIAALDARDRYLSGIAERQLHYRATETRNRKLEAIEEERLTVEALKYRILGSRSISLLDAAPAQTLTTT